jgi:hypothetical protein
MRPHACGGIVQLGKKLGPEGGPSNYVLLLVEGIGRVPYLITCRLIGSYPFLPHSCSIFLASLSLSFLYVQYMGACLN